MSCKHCGYEEDHSPTCPHYKEDNLEEFMNNQVDTGWKEEVSLDYLVDDFVKSIKGSTWEFMRESLKALISKVEQSAIERTKAKVVEMLVGLMGGGSDEHHRGVQDCAKFLKDRLNEL
jgi:hypothetical protein